MKKAKLFFSSYKGYGCAHVLGLILLLPEWCWFVCATRGRWSPES